MELIDYVRAVRKRKIMIMVGTLVCLLAAFVACRAMPKTYEATATLLIEGSMVPPDEQAQYPSGEVVRISGTTYRGIARSKAAMNKVLGDFNLGEPPYRFVLEDLYGVIAVKPVRNSRLLEVKAQFTDPQMARDVANLVAQEAVEAASRLTVSGSSKSRDLIEKHLNAATEELAEAEAELLEFKKEARLAIVRQKLAILLKRKMDVELRLADTQVSIASHERSLRAVEKEFAGRSRTIKLSRSLAENQLYQQALAGLAGADVEELFNLTMEVEVADPTYTHLEQNLVGLRSTLEGLLATRQTLGDETQKNSVELDAVQDELATKETELERLQDACDVKEQNYRFLVKKFDEASIQVASRSQDVELIDPALVPNRPVKPRTRAIMGGVGFVSLVFFLSLASFLEYLEIAGRQRRQ